MRFMVFLIIGTCILQGNSFSQESGKIIEAWFPKGNLKAFEGESYGQSSKRILIFSTDSTGYFEEVGAPNIKDEFNYQLLADSLVMATKNDTIRASIVEFSDETLILDFDSNTRLSYSPIRSLVSQLFGKTIPAPNFNDQIWEFKIPTEYGDVYSLEIHFLKYLKDSAQVSAEYRAITKSADTKIHLIDMNNQIFWNANQHHQLRVIRIETLYASHIPFEVALIRKYSKNRLKLLTWHRGTPVSIEGKRIVLTTDKKRRKFVSFLTSQKWRIDSEKTVGRRPKEGDVLLDLGTVRDVFGELDYTPDSTLLLNQSDIDEHLLTLEFSRQGEYKIMRAKRVLDQGRWEIQMNESQIKLSSTRNHGDGIYGGLLEIKSLSKNKLILRRCLITFLRNYGETQVSRLETYKPMTIDHFNQ